jgi:hypothetical protein
MKLHRLFNLTELEPATGLYFVRMEDAEKFKQMIVWPYVKEGRWPLAAGHSIPLEKLDLRVETVELAAVIEEHMMVVVMEHAGKLGTAPFLTGDCFNPDDWAQCSPLDLAHPIYGPRLELAQQRLKSGN